MTPYLVKLADEVIREYGYDECTADIVADRNKFTEETKKHLTSAWGPIKKYNHETLGRIICSLSEVFSETKISFTYEGLAFKAFRALAAHCLALVISERLVPTRGSTVTPFVRKKRAA